MKKRINKLYAYIKENYKKIIIDLVALSLFILFCYYPLPYVVYRPGGLINLNDRITVENATKISGSFNMSYVTVARGNIPNLLLALVINDWDIYKEEDSLAYDDDYETNLKISQMDMENSVDVAKLVAFEKAGYDVQIKSKQIVVKSVEKAAKTNLKALDKIIQIEGVDCKDIKVVREFIGKYNIGDRISMKVLTDSGEESRYAVIYEYQERKIVGITFFERYIYDTEVDVKFKSKASESGSSGGLMLTLTMYDQLTAKDLTNGKTVVGTGTIDKDGNVGAIGGVKYKMLGAKNDADIYLVPDDNCEEAKRVYEKYDLQFEMVCIKSFDEAISYLRGER